MTAARRKLMQPVSGVTPLSITKTAEAGTGTNGTSWNAGTLSIGAAPGAGERRWVAVYGCGQAGGAITGISIGGVAATLVVDSAPDRYNAIYMREVAAGTTAEIIVSFSGTSTRHGISVHRIISGSSADLIGAGPADTAIDDTHAVGVLSMALDVPAGGCALAGAFSNSGSTATWTGLTEATDFAFDGATELVQAAQDAFATLQTGLTITATNADTTPSTYLGLAASWAP